MRRPGQIPAVLYPSQSVSLTLRITTTRNQTVVNGVIGLRRHYMTPCGAFSNGSQNLTMQFYWTCMLTTFDPILIKYLQLLKMAVLQRQMQTYRADKRYRGNLVPRVPLPPLHWSGEGKKLVPEKDKNWTRLVWSNMILFTT